MKKANYSAPKMERMEMELEAPIAISGPKFDGTTTGGPFNP